LTERIHHDRCSYLHSVVGTGRNAGLPS